MANVCQYKIQVTGTKVACNALINMMPLYCDEKEILSEEGTDEKYTIVFSGACKWSVDSYTNPMDNPQPLTQEKIEAVEEGDHWDKTLKDKSALLSCEIFCCSIDADEKTPEILEHYICGKESCHDTFPTELLFYSINDDREERIELYYNSDDVQCFSLHGYSNSLLVDILQKYNYKSEKIKDIQSFSVDGQLSDYSGVLSIEDLTATLISAYIDFGDGDNGMKEELYRRKLEIARAFTYIEGTSCEGFDTAEYGDWNEGLFSGYDFLLKNGIYNAYRTCYGG